MEKSYDILALIELNEAKEADAREYYYQLLDSLQGSKYEEKIKEIISDEINHSIILMRIAEDISKIKGNEYQSILELKKEGN